MGRQRWPGRRVGRLLLLVVLASAAVPVGAAESGGEPADPDLERVEAQLEEARAEIREFHEAGGEEDDPEHPRRRWAAELLRWREERPGSKAAGRATVEALHFMLHAGQAEEAVERAGALPVDDGAWPELLGILFEGAELLGRYATFLDRGRALLAVEIEPQARARLRFRIAQALWVEGEFEAAAAELAELRQEAPDDGWRQRAEAAAAELDHPGLRGLPAAERSGRDLWQLPGRLFDELGVGAGDRVADIGAGGGYFSFLLARWVGPAGRVWAVEIDERALERLAEGAADRGLKAIETVLGREDDPRLPAGELDAILVVDTYHEMVDPAAMLAAMSRALAPGGRLAIVDIPDELGREREEYGDRHKIPVEVVIEEAASAGLRLRSYHDDFAGHGGGRSMYLAVFARPAGDGE